MALRSGSLFLVLTAVLLLIPRIAAAQEAEAPAKPRLNFSLSSFIPPAVRSNAARLDVTPGTPEARPGRSMVLSALYATTALSQGLDAHSTMRALNAGATERNPLMSYLTSHPPAFVALKTGAAAGLIYAGQRLAKRNKTHAVIALVAVNSAYLTIAAHNYRVASRLR
jgi:hypothetical protein